MNNIIHVEILRAEKKITTRDGNERIVCCPHCKRKMTLKSLTHTYVVELVLEKGGKQTVLTLFPNVIATLSIDMTIIDEELLMLENYDY